MATIETPQPDIVRDVDDTAIGEAYDLEIGTMYALADSTFMLAIDSGAIVERSDLEQLHSLIGKVLGRATGAGSLAAG